MYVVLEKIEELDLNQSNIFVGVLSFLTGLILLVYLCTNL
jgi:hypothetical protein